MTVRLLSVLSSSCRPPPRRVLSEPRVESNADQLARGPVQRERARASAAMERPRQAHARGDGVTRVTAAEPPSLWSARNLLGHGHGGSPLPFRFERCSATELYAGALKQKRPVAKGPGRVVALQRS